MRKSTLLLLSVVFFMTACNITAQQTNKLYDADNTMTVVFYNVENLMDTIDDPNTRDDEFVPTSEKRWTSERYHQKIKNLAWVFANINQNELPEIIGMAEIETREVVEDIANQPILKSGDYVVVHEPGEEARGIEVALMYRKDALKNVTHEVLKVKHSLKPDYHGRDILYVKGSAGSDEFHIFVNHWKSRRGSKSETELFRVEAAQVLRDKVDEILKDNPKAKIIIMGDMNDEPSDRSIHQTLFATNRIKGAKKDEFYNLMFDKHINKQGTYNFRGDWNMLDNLIVSQSLLHAKKGYVVCPDGGQIFYNRRLLYDNNKLGDFTPARTYSGPRYHGGYSDHLPVYFMMRK